MSVICCCLLLRRSTTALGNHRSVAVRISELIECRSHRITPDVLDWNWSAHGAGEKGEKKSWLFGADDAIGRTAFVQRTWRPLPTHRMHWFFFICYGIPKGFQKNAEQLVSPSIRTGNSRLVHSKLTEVLGPTVPSFVSSCSPIIVLTISAAMWFLTM
jgi:hypothetical protein